MAKKQKFYVVWVGKLPGIYTKWDECKAQVLGFEGAKYKAFDTKLEAENAYNAAYTKILKPSNNTSKNKNILPKTNDKIIANSLAVDAACSGNPGIMEYQGVETKTKKVVFHNGPFSEGTNNIGEFLAIVHALALLKKNNNTTTCIYTDSKTAMSWIKKKKSGTKLNQTDANKELFELLRRAENWLATNDYQTKILKWQTDEWGEIPADFGRK